MLKRILCIMLALLLCGQPISTLAEETKEVQYQLYGGIETREPISLEEERPSIQNYVEVGKYSEAELFFELEEIIKEALLTGEDVVDLSSMNLNVNQYDLQNLVYFSPYFGNGIDFICYYYSDGTYAQIQLYNTMTIEETKVFFNNVKIKVDEIYSKLSKAVSEEEKALILHDYLVYEYAYDFDNYQNGTIPQDSYRASGLLMNGTGVCQSYAYAYQYFLNMVGMECYVTSSSSMNHAWNIVSIDDSYYHVDCTWDDPVVDRFGMVSHEHFLVSDAVFQSERNHFGWDLTELVCENTKYDDYYWVGVDSQIILENDFSYFISDSNIVRRNLKDNTEETIKNLGLWYVWDSYSYWVGAFSGLFMQEDALYYNTSTEIRKIATDGTNDTVVYQPDISEGYVYGIKKQGTELKYVIKQEPMVSGQIFTADVVLDNVNSSFDSLTDIAEGQWYYEAVEYVYHHNYMTGITETLFGPNEKLDRAQFAVILHRMEQTPEVAYNDKFSDVMDEQWYTDAILWASETNVVSGYQDGRYGTTDNISREQMAVMMYRYALLKEYDVTQKSDYSSFSDAQNVSDYAKEAMEWAVGTGIISGKTGKIIDPQGTATRAECASIIMRFTEKYGK